MKRVPPVVLAFLFAAAAAADQWTAVAPPERLGYWVVAADPRDRNVLYADAVNGRQLWKSVDAGRTWAPTTLTATEGFTTVTVESARPGGVTALYVFVDIFVARSANGGSTWTTRQFLTTLGVANGVAVDANKPDVLYLSVQRACFGSCTRGGVLRSTNGGNSWSSVLADADVNQVVADPVASDIVYATTFTAGVLRSLDAGATWRAIGPQLAGAMLLIDPTTGMTLYLIGGTSVWRSDDRGETWLPVLGIRPAEWAIRGMFGGAVHPNDRSVLVVNRGAGGLFRSRDGGASWEALRAGLEDPLNPGLTATVRQVAYAADGTLWAASGVVGLHVLAPSPPRRRAITH